MYCKNAQAAEFLDNQAHLIQFCKLWISLLWTCRVSQTFVSLTRLRLKWLQRLQRCMGSANKIKTATRGCSSEKMEKPMTVGWRTSPWSLCEEDRGSVLVARPVTTVICINIELQWGEAKQRFLSFPPSHNQRPLKPSSESAYRRSEELSEKWLNTLLDLLVVSSVWSCRM